MRVGKPCEKPLADIVSLPNHPVRSAPEERRRGKESRQEGEESRTGVRRVSREES